MCCTCVFVNFLSLFFEFVYIQVNTVFDNLNATKHFNGYVFFLEEDHYVAPDFLAVARQLMELRQAKCHDCDFINLGMYTTVRSLGNHVSPCNHYWYILVHAIQCSSVLP